MIHAQTVGCSVMIAPQSVATNATATGHIDTKGADYLSVNFLLNSAAAASSNPAVLKLGESDDTVVTNFADISGAVGDTDFTVPDADTSSAQIVRLNVALQGRKRYIMAYITTAGAAQICSAIGELSRADDSTVNRAKNAATVDL